MKNSSLTQYGQNFLLLFGTGITLFFCLLCTYRPFTLSSLGFKIYDSMLRDLPPNEEENRPVIVAIDEKSLAQFGQWPWPRYRVAQLFDKLNSLQPQAVGVDILFAESDRTSLHILRKNLKNDFDATLLIDGTTNPPENNDLVLANSLKQGPYVAGFKFLFEGKGNSTKTQLLHPLATSYFKNQSDLNNPQLFEAVDMVAPLKEFSRAIKSSGFLNCAADTDGILRRVPLLIAYQKNVYPSLGLATAMQALNSKNIELDIEQNKLQAVILDNHRIPVDHAGNILVAYQGKSHFFEYISATDILNNNIAKERIQGKIVLVGATATGLQDTHATPIGSYYPGMEVHATIIDNIVNKHFLSRPLWAGGAELSAVFLFGLFSTIILSKAKPLISVLFLLTGSAGLWYGSFFLLKNQYVFINPLWPLLVLFSNFSMLNLAKFWNEERKVEAQTKEIMLAQNTTIRSLTSLAETRDDETGGHILRTQQYIRVLSKQLATLPKYKKVLQRSTIDLLFRSAPLHDIGKVGVSDNILMSPDQLTKEEFARMKNHTIYGYETLLKAESLLLDKQGHSFLQMAQEIAYTHHEKWDGTGYPRGLREEEIPLSGRLMALVDVYDALISRRRYKLPFSHQEAKQIIQQESGSHFDPDIVKAFLATEKSFQRIAECFVDDTKPAEYQLQFLEK